MPLLQLATVPLVQVVMPMYLLQRIHDGPCRWCSQGLRMHLHHSQPPLATSSLKFQHPFRHLVHQVESKDILVRNI